MDLEIRKPDRPLPEIAADAIAQLIVSGELRPGDRLPNEYELAGRLGVGRSTVREAIKLLVSRNVLEIHRGNGTYVCEHTGVTKDPLGLQFIADKKRLGLDLCDVRLMIEPAIVRLSATHATKEDIARMQALCDDIRSRLLEGREYSEQDTELHTLFATCSGNCVVPRLIPFLNESIPLFITLTDRRMRQETIDTHQTIVDAIARHDADAASAAMVRHLTGNRELIEALPDQAESEAASGEGPSQS